MREHSTTYKIPSDTQYESARILVVDDEPLVGRVVAGRLKAHGFTDVRWINDPKMALETIASFQPDLILLDILMPELSGLELLHQIKSHREHSSITVVMLSAADKKSKYRSLRMGAADFINKPVNAQELIDQVVSVLQTF